MPITPKENFSINKLNYYSILDTDHKLDHICVLLENIRDSLKTSTGEKHVEEWYQQKNLEWQNKYDTDTAQLKAENERLREALKYIVDRGYTGASYVAQQSLNEVTK